MCEIPPNEVEFSRLSLVDEIGRVFSWRNGIYRAISAESTCRVQRLFESGLIDSLYSEGLIPHTAITDHSLVGYDLVLRHESIPRQSYPHEWSFEMLRDAALITLKVASIAATFGYRIKDCHPYNVMFFGAQPLFVDFGSLVCKGDGEPSVSNDIKYAFFYPLSAWTNCSEFLARRILNSVVLPTSICEQCQDHFGLSESTFSQTFWMRLKCIAHRIGGTPLQKLYRFIFPRDLSQPIAVDNSSDWQRKIESLAPPSAKTNWEGYQDEYFIEGELKTTKRFDRLVCIVNGLDGRTAVDLAGNQGLLSLALLKRTDLTHISCTDSDAYAIDKLYLYCRDRLSVAEKRRIFPAVSDVMIPEINYFTPLPAERLRSDIVLALAITHHLLLGSRFQLDFVLKRISEFTTRYAVVEFMPLGLWDGKISKPIPDWYNEAWFAEGFSKYFEVMLREELEENRIVFAGRKL